MSIELEKCKICGGNIAPKIYRCPHCGAELRTVRNKKLGCISIAVLPVAIILYRTGSSLSYNSTSPHILLVVGIFAIIAALVSIAICFTKPNA